MTWKASRLLCYCFSISVASSLLYSGAVFLFFYILTLFLTLFCNFTSGSCSILVVCFPGTVFFFGCGNEANVSDSLLISSFSSGRVCSGSAVHRSACRHHRHLHLPSSGRAWAPAHLVEEWADFGAWGTRQTQEQQQVMTKLHFVYIPEIYKSPARYKNV